MFRKNVSLRFKSIITDLSLPGLLKVGEILCAPSEEDDRESKEELEKRLSACEKEVYEYISAAELSGDGTQISLVYEDNLGAEGKCINMINFNTNASECVRLVRDGAITSSMIFNKKDPFSRCSYNVSSIPLEFGIYTRAVDNKLTENGGSLMLDYVLEIRGHKVQRCQTFINILSRGK